MKKSYMRNAIIFITAALCLAACAQDTDIDFNGTISGAMNPMETKNVTLNTYTGRLEWSKVEIPGKPVSKYVVYRSTSLLNAYSESAVPQPFPPTNTFCIVPIGPMYYYRIKTYFNSDTEHGPLSSAFATTEK